LKKRIAEQQASAKAAAGTDGAAALSEEQMKRVVRTTARMYADMGTYATGYYAAQKALLSEQKDEYALYVTDKVLLEKWYSREVLKLEQQLAIAQGSLWERRKAAYLNGLTEMEAAERDRMAQAMWVMDETERGWKTFWDPVIDESMTAKEAMNEFFRTYFLNIAKAQATLAMTKLWNVAAGPVFGAVTGAVFGVSGAAAGAASAAVGHGGGRVGSLSASRLVDSSVFADAPRFHGLRPGERAVIAQDDEVISRPGGGAAAIGGPTTVNYITIKALDTQDVKRALAKEKNFVADLTFSATKGNHPAGRYER
jgi:hypothetical protein